MRNACNDAAEETAIILDRGQFFSSRLNPFSAQRLVRSDWTETERIERAHWPRSHGEDIPDDPAHARRRALERFDRAGMIVRFDLERNRQPIPDIDNSCIFFAC